MFGTIEKNINGEFVLQGFTSYEMSLKNVEVLDCPLSNSDVGNVAYLKNNQLQVTLQKVITEEEFSQTVK